MGYAFISYSTKNQAAADAMRNLFNKHNIDTWMAPYDIPVGSKYAAVITKAIRECSCFVLLLSNDSQASDAVDSEVELAAVTFKKAIIPVEIEKVVLNDSFIFYLHNKQILGVQEVNESSQSIKQVLEVVRTYTQGYESDEVDIIPDQQDNTNHKMVFEDDFAFEGNCLHSYSGTSPNITIPEGVTRILANAFENNEFLEKVTVPSSVEIIEPFAFSCCKNLTNVVLSDGVDIIDERAFSYCENLYAISIPATVSSIGDNAFYNCYDLSNIYINDLESWCEIDFGIDDGSNPLNNGAALFLNGELINELIIPYGVKTINEKSFSGCVSITSVVIPDTVTDIKDSAFENCSNLETLVIPGSVKNISFCAFSFCRKLNDLVIENGVETICEWAFEFCTTLKRITIPKSVKYLGKCAFCGCHNLTDVTIPYDLLLKSKSAFDEDVYEKLVAKYAPTPTAEKQATADISDFVIENGVLVEYKGTSKAVIIPNGVVSIGKYCFKKKDVETVVIPDSVKRIESFAFWCCESLRFVTIPNGVTYIGTFAFSECKCLESITIPDTVTTIGDSAFSICKSLTSIIIPNGITSIGKELFRFCPNLKSVTLPNTVISIGKGAFWRCKSLSSITVPNSVANLGDEVFVGCTSLTGVNISRDLLLKSKKAFDEDLYKKLLAAGCHE